LDNAVVLDEFAVVNEDGLRFPDEFVRHKMLDFIGDMALLGLPLQGYFQIYCSGHAVNNAFLRMLHENRAYYLEEVELSIPAQHSEREAVPAGLLQGVSATA
jgi:UDP-3-O-[3-hydroxymyristoyl] N-acetylglucosamine deacetylase